ncbi:uncharacterized protein C8Q71DRAFT_704397 [Rhodofomes roseus]|uniref:Uncharacterized protein n=1 Tax=Rhodofomes roseus TaxID=34475 RepID=A0ABQ8KKZ5_9APHY|nr:uncharacterized protein C8Q71DRAFT_704397 [Rhodofomes roseus]KAH9838984.1 hypothetical protein C8Q71DRAFT_704397 [Rhodofomes roseus]
MFRNVRVGSVSHVALLAVFLAASFYFNVTLLDTAKRVKAARAGRLRAQKRFSQSVIDEDAYAWVGDDFPRTFPVDARPVQTTFEESVRYSLSTAEAGDEWLWTAPLAGDNHVRLGPEKRMFAVPMFHELHCLRNMRSAMVDGLDSLGAVGQAHIHHCFNYLRQWTLCEADVSLEPGNFEERDFEREREGATRMCVDWEPVYSAAERNWDEWVQFRDAHGLTPQA